MKLLVDDAKMKNKNRLIAHYTDTSFVIDNEFERIVLYRIYM